MAVLTGRRIGIAGWFAGIGIATERGPSPRSRPTAGDWSSALHHPSELVEPSSWTAWIDAQAFAVARS